MKKQKTFGHMTPYCWVLEVTHGCNLRCGHCNCALDPVPKTYRFMPLETAECAAQIIAAVNPTSRLDICGGGEPTLNPDLVEIIRLIRKIVPKLQIQVTTNGTMLTKGRISYGEILNAGANFVYTDMYAPRSTFHRLANESGFSWYEYYAAPKDAPSPWTYHGKPDLRSIVLQENPSNWPRSRKSANLLGTWFNHLDWDAAKKFGLSPCFEPPARRCNQPFVYTMIDAGGNYVLCGQDNVGETSGQLGNVSEGFEGFKRFWFSAFMQMVRKNLRVKNRAGNPQCCRCSVTFSRCDYELWNDADFDRYYTHDGWHDLTVNHQEQYRRRVDRMKKTIDATGLPTVPWSGFTPEAEVTTGINPKSTRSTKSKMRDDFCAFIISHGRPDHVYTFNSLLSGGYTGKIYIVIDDEDTTAEKYREKFGARVLQFCKADYAAKLDEGDNTGKRISTIYARAALFDLAASVGCRYFIQLDDDYPSWMYLRIDSSFQYANIGVRHCIDDVFSALIEFLDRSGAITVCASQGGDHIGGAGDGSSANSPRLRRKAMNSFVCSTDRPWSMFGRMNEDVNTYVTDGRRGVLFFTAQQIQINQLPTQSNAGGMSGLYLDSGTYVKSFYSVMYAPSCVKIGTLNDPRAPNYRVHHKISWEIAVPKIIGEQWRRPR